MPSAKKVSCRVISKTWLTPSVVSIRFEPSRSFDYEAGQFLSIVVPAKDPRDRRRIYSFASSGSPSSVSPGQLPGYELCIKQVPGGPGSEYMAKLKPGDVFEATAPYGDFIFHPKPGKNVCFIATGTGVAPLRSMLGSQLFQDDRPPKTLVLFGAASELEIVYPVSSYHELGAEFVAAISRPGPEWKGFKGRVTDYLRQLPLSWPWHSTEFYVCGNGEMIHEVVKILREGHGVPEAALHYEIYFSPKKSSESLPEAA